MTIFVDLVKILHNVNNNNNKHCFLNILMTTINNKYIIVVCQNRVEDIRVEDIIE